MTNYRVALCQMDSGENREKNLDTACALLEEAAAQGAALVAFPEVFNVIDLGETEPEEIPGGVTVTRMAEKARELGLWVLCGSLWEKNPTGGKKKNTSVLLDPKGQVVATYSKLHLFDATLPDGSRSLESDQVEPGDRLVVADTELGKLGFSICYDVRFPELYRYLALQGAEVIFVPAEFNRGTGEKHWEPLLRARAIENGCYIVAPGQVGVKQTVNGAYPCYGHSMVVDPNGVVIAQADQQVGVTIAEIDLGLVAEQRRRLPVLANRRTDVYDLSLVNRKTGKR
jgi:predicted amidohydrolase